MSDKQADDGVIEAMMKRLPTRLNRARGLEQKVSRGERLDDNDLAFLNRVFRDAREVLPLVERHPEYQPLCSQVIDLYFQITKRALENEQRHP